MQDQNSNQTLDPIKQKLKFRITEISSQEEGYPASELLNHSPYSKGWQSSRFCDYPQEITVEFPSYVKVKQLQFLSHQYKISSKIEILIFNPKGSKKYKKIGFLSLDSNEQSNFQARELKSVYIDYECLKIKLLLHRCHINQLNQSVQVGLIAFNVLGHPIIKNPFDQPPNFNKNPNTDKLEDELLYDPVTYKRLKALEKAKLRAIDVEDFNEAQKIKDAIDRLKSVSNQLIVLEERKAIAIKNDEFQSAKIIKYEIERLRNAVAGINIELQQENPNYKNILPSINSKKYTQEEENERINHQMYGGPQIGEYDDPGLMNKGNIRNKTNLRQDSHLDKYPLNSDMIMTEDQYTDKTKYVNQGTKLYSNKQQNYAQGMGDNNYEQSYAQPNIKKQNEEERFYNNKVMSNDPDDRPIKGTDKPFGNAISTEIKKEGFPSGINDNNKSEDDDEVGDDIPARYYKDAEPLIPYLSHDLAKLLFSNSWRSKEKGLKVLIEEVKAYPHSQLLSAHPSDKIVTAIVGILAHTLTSTVSHVILESMQLMKILVNKFHNSHVKGFYRGDLDKYMDSCLTYILERVGDSVIKIKERAENTTLEIANNTIFGSKIIFEHLISGDIKKTLKNSARHLSGRLQLINRMIENFGLNTEEVGVEALMECAFNGYRNPNKEVRDAAYDVIMNCYKFMGQQVRSFYKDLRQAQIETLEEGFDKVDQENVRDKFQDNNKIEVTTKKQPGKKGIIKNNESPQIQPNSDDDAEFNNYNKKQSNNKFSNQNAYEEGNNY